MVMKSSPDRPILVAGGAGFLGSHLCERLLHDGHAVLCVDDFTTGAVANIQAMQENPRFRLLRHDVTEPLRADVKAVFNLACPASPVHYQAEPIRTTMTSVKGTLHLLELARWAGVPLLQASTSEVYGDPSVHPQPEGYWGNVNPTGIRACYDEGKRCAESLCFDFQRRHDVAIRVARIFNTYGPRMQVDDGRVVSNFIVQALRDDPITIYGDGHQTRSFCYVDDLIEGLVRFMEAPDTVPSPMNLGNPNEFTMLELAERVIALTGSTSTFVFKPLPGDDPAQRRPIIDRARAELGWEPAVQLEEGLRRTIEYFDAVLSGDSVSARRDRASRGKLRGVATVPSRNGSHPGAGVNGSRGVHPGERRHVQR
jgi:UDP-glucuronate decarboxylase